MSLAARHQKVPSLSTAQFLSRRPARMPGFSPKCAPSPWPWPRGEDPVQPHPSAQPGTLQGPDSSPSPLVLSQGKSRAPHPGPVHTHPDSHPWASPETQREEIKEGAGGEGSQRNNTFLGQKCSLYKPHICIPHSPPQMPAPQDRTGSVLPWLHLLSSI